MPQPTRIPASPTGSTAAQRSDRLTDAENRPAGSTSGASLTSPVSPKPPSGTPFDPSRPAQHAPRHVLSFGQPPAAASPGDRALSTEPSASPTSGWSVADASAAASTLPSPEVHPAEEAAPVSPSVAHIAHLSQADGLRDENKRLKDRPKTMAAVSYLTRKYKGVEVSRLSRGNLTAQQVYDLRSEGQRKRKASDDAPSPLAFAGGDPWAAKRHRVAVMAPSIPLEQGFLARPAEGPLGVAVGARVGDADPEVAAAVKLLSEAEAAYDGRWIRPEIKAAVKTLHGKQSASDIAAYSPFSRRQVNNQFSELTKRQKIALETAAMNPDLAPPKRAPMKRHPFAVVDRVAQLKAQGLSNSEISKAMDNACTAKEVSHLLQSMTAKQRVEHWKQAPTQPKSVAEPSVDLIALAPLIPAMAPQPGALMTLRADQAVTLELNKGFVFRLQTARGSITARVTNHHPAGAGLKGYIEALAPKREG